MEWANVSLNAAGNVLGTFEFDFNCRWQQPVVAPVLIIMVNRRLIRAVPLLPNLSAPHQPTAEFLDLCFTISSG